MYEKVYTALAPITFKNDSDTFLTVLSYNKYWDAAFARSMSSWFRIFHDGSFARYGTPGGTYLYGGRYGGKPAFWEEWTGYIYGASDVNGMPDLNNPLNPDYPMTYQHAYFPSIGWFVDDNGSVFVRRLSANALEVRKLADGSLVRTITHNLAVSFDTLCWVSDGVICGIRYSDGYVAFLDYLGAGGLLTTGMLEHCRLATYDPTCQVFWTYAYDNLIRIYVKSDQPTTLSEPVFSGDVVAKAVLTVKVCLTGATGEPCSGWWIHWGLEASGGEGPYGSLKLSTSKTGDDGYAENVYYAPSDGEIGDTKVTAWVEL